jgi:uncharacterized membrane protein
MGILRLRFTRRQIERMMDIESIQAAIKEAEVRTSGEIRVSISRFFWGSVVKAAEKAFMRLGMLETRDRNGILFFVVPSRKRFAIIGDAGIHAEVGQKFWDRLATVLREEFGKGEFTSGLLKSIREAGEELSAHFPHDPESDVNELPDDVEIH